MARKGSHQRKHTRRSIKGKEFPAGRGRRVGERVTSSKVDKVAGRELQLWIENDGTLYRQQYSPIIKNLARKKYRGVYNSGKAAKLFMHLADEGARRYNWETSRQRGIPSYFNKPTRDWVARNLRDDFEVEFRLGNYSQYKQKYLR